ncbi:MULTISPECIES: HBL/NHE enterotoxin family protein [Bacillus]|uniref:non-hemolytic enterotoxin subunit C n=1 Tax=Bacillus TaxID=1386 RepID=UPI001F5AF93B|nr:HBL/NHE enterotoxin family protein [Bacillus cereus]HDR6957629.1 HBL/NHE enterotoxin family protein [Bacillus cereus]
MNKNLYKKIILSTIITGMAASNVIPLHTLAAEQTVSQQQESLKNYSLGPGEFKEVMGKMVANILTMDSYANTISNQQLTDLSKISSINGDLQANMIKHQRDAIENADFWFMYLKTRIMYTHQNIVNYNDTFQASYKLLLTAIEQKDTEKLKYELENLYNSILYNSQKLDVLLEKLKNFQGEIAENTRNFKEDFNQLENILESTNAGIPLLQQRIENCNNTIKENYDKRGGYIALSVFMPPIGIPLIVTTDKNIASAQQEIEQLKSRISGAEAEVVILTDAKNKTEHMAATVGTAVTALENIKTQWGTVEKKYKSLIDSVDNISLDLFDEIIRADLNTAKDNWQDLKNYTDKLYEGAKIAQNK